MDSCVEKGSTGSTFPIYVVLDCRSWGRFPNLQVQPIWIDVAWQPTVLTCWKFIITRPMHPCDNSRNTHRVWFVLLGAFDFQIFQYVTCADFWKCFYVFQNRSLPRLDGSGQIRSSSTHHLALYIRRCRWCSARYRSAKYSLVPQCRYNQTLKVLQPEFYNCSQGYQKAKVVTSQLQHCVCKSACLKSKNYQTTKT